MRLEPTISTLTAIRSIRMAKRDSDGYRIRKYFSLNMLKSIVFIMYVNLKLVLRSYTSLYGIFMSACLTLFIYISALHYDRNANCQHDESQSMISSLRTKFRLMDSFKMRHHTDRPRDPTRKEDTDNVASSIHNLFQSMHIMPKHTETDQGKIAEEKEIESRKLNGMCFNIPESRDLMLRSVKMKIKIF